MKALAIDTSTFVMGVAIVDGDQVLGEVITNFKKNHSIRLMPAINELMKDAGVGPNELDRVIVAHGPGSYTGVRIGVTTAKTMAWTLAIPLVGVSSLEVLAQNGRYFNGLVCPIFDARRGQVYTGLYGNIECEFGNLIEDQICLSQDWAKQLDHYDDNILFLGNDVPIHKDTIKGQLGNKVSFGKFSDCNSRPSELARLGMEKEPTKEVHIFTPNYIRMAEAEVNWLANQKNKH